MKKPKNKKDSLIFSKLKVFFLWYWNFTKKSLANLEKFLDSEWGCLVYLLFATIIVVLKVLIPLISLAVLIYLIIKFIVTFIVAFIAAHFIWIILIGLVLIIILIILLIKNIFDI